MEVYHSKFRNENDVRCLHSLFKVIFKISPPHCAVRGGKLSEVNFNSVTQT